MPRIALLLAATLSTGCAEALFSIDTYRTHDAYTEASLREFAAASAEGPITKAGVLATLGPPIYVIGQDTGEIFVYRRLARDNRTINLNPAMVSVPISLPPIPIYFNSDTSGRDDTLMVFFDSEGWMQGASINLGIADTGGSEPALVGEETQELLE
jgi:hypothetical protein